MLGRMQARAFYPMFRCSECTCARPKMSQCTICERCVRCCIYGDTPCGVHLIGNWHTSHLQPWCQTHSPATVAQHDAEGDSVPQRALKRPDENNACNEHSLDLVAQETDEEEDLDVWNTMSRKNNEDALEGCFEGGESETATADSPVEPSPSDSVDAQDAPHRLEAPQT